MVNFHFLCIKYTAPVNIFIISCNEATKRYCQYVVFLSFIRAKWKHWFEMSNNIPGLFTSDMKAGDWIAYSKRTLSKTKSLP